MGRKTKMNNITSPELLAQVNPKNVALLNEFLDYLQSIQRSNSTIDAYRGDIQIAFVWALQNIDNKFFVDWTKRNIMAYQNWLISNNKNSPARVRRLKAALSSMGNFVENICDDDYPNYRNIVNKVENPPLQAVREKTVWTDTELESLLEKLIDRGDIEKACFLALGMYSGRRKSELCRFRVSDFAPERLVCGGSLYKSSPIKTKGRGNGKIIPCYTLAKQFQPYLDAWMVEREKCGIESEWLFPMQFDPTKHIQTSTADSWANTYSSIAGKPAYIHSLRHYFTTSLAKAGIPDSVIQSIVAWESSDMVRLYTDIDADEQISMYFNENGITVPERKGLSDI